MITTAAQGTAETAETAETGNCGNCGTGETAETAETRRKLRKLRNCRKPVHFIESFTRTIFFTSSKVSCPEFLTTKETDLWSHHFIELFQGFSVIRTSSVRETAELIVHYTKLKGGGMQSREPPYTHSLNEMGNRQRNRNPRLCRSSHKVKRSNITARQQRYHAFRRFPAACPLPEKYSNFDNSFYSLQTMIQEKQPSEIEKIQIPSGAQGKKTHSSQGCPRLESS
jgi:hypothetical protein